MNGLFFEEEKKKEEKYIPPKPPSYFDVFNKLKNRTAKNDLKYFDEYMFITHLSFNQNTLQYAILLNNSFIKPEHSFEIAKFLVPNLPYIKWIKKSKPDKDLNAIMWYFNVGKETAKRYKEMLSKEELEEIKEWYKES